MSTNLRKIKQSNLHAELVSASLLLYTGCRNKFGITRSIMLLVMTLFLLGSNTSFSQQCNPQFSISNFVIGNGVASELIGDDNTVGATIGQPFFETIKKTNQNSVVGGFWSFHNLEPQSPFVTASDGDFVDVVTVNWNIIEDPIGPPVTGQYVKLYRNGSLLTSLPIIQTTYQDFNVQPGLVYLYEVTTSNDLGESQKIGDVGFVNPNGIVTGYIQTRNNNPVNEVEVRLEPYLGYALDFNGTSDKITLTDSAYNNLSSGTIEAWVFLSQRANNTIISKQHAGGEIMGALTIGYYFDASGNPQSGTSDSGKIFFHGHNGVAAASSNAKLKTNKWYHIAVTFSTSKAEFYINGSLDNTVSGDFSIPNDVMPSDPTLIKTYIGGWSGGNKFYKGSLDELRIWNTVRTKKELIANMKRTMSGDDSGMVAYWKFDEGQGSRIFDLTESKNNGALCGPIYQNVNKAPIYTSALTDVQGNYRVKGVSYGTGTTFSVIPTKTTIIGRALQFDGTNDYVSFPNNIVYPLASFTIETWVYLPATSATGERIFDFGTGTSNVMYLTGKSSSGNPQFIVKKTGSSEEQINSSVPLPITQWTHIAISYDSATTTGKMYVDGEEVGTNSGLTTMPKDLGTTTQNYFGKSQSNGNYLSGRLDDFRIWNVARTQQQIQANMNQPLTGSETGLRSYWKMNEGNSTTLYDATPYARAGNLLNVDTLTVWTDEIALNETFEHVFQPESRNATLSQQSPSVDQVDYTDISQLSVTGFVKYDGSNCFVEAAEILVDGRSAIPAIYTDAGGKFIAEFEPGSSHRLTPKKLNHSFIPPYWDITNINQPIILTRPFQDQEKHTFSGSVVGGNCRLPIGVAEVRIVSTNECKDTTVLTNPLDGKFTINNLPPLNYNVFVKHPNPVITFEGIQKSLVEGNDSADFIYRAPLETRIEGVPVNACNIPTIEKGKKKAVRYKVFETYRNGDTETECLLQNGYVIVVDNLGNIQRRDTISVVNGIARDTIKGGVPNILGGGAHPYQKNFQIVAVDELNRTISAEQWMYVTGSKARGNFFATRTPQIPLWVLHDPPGDGSFSFINTDQTLSNSISFSMVNENSAGAYVALHLGPDITTSVGFGVETELEVNVTLDLTVSTAMGVSQTSATEQSWSFTTSEMFSTSDADQVIGAGGDVFIGGAMNMQYGITDILSLDSCMPNVSQDLLLIPENFATTFMFSESHILNTVIPNLLTIGDTVSANLWQSFIDKNNQEKTNATFVRNVSFDAGSPYDNSETNERSSTQTHEVSMFINTDVAVDAGVEVNGVGVSGGFNITTQVTTGQSRSQTTTTTQTIGYHLADDDAGDYYSINVKKDRVYGTPVFQTVSGASSCPWEAGTSPREGAQLSISPATQINVPPDENAQFTLQLANTSPTNEARAYVLMLDHTHNPFGAEITVGGDAINGSQTIVLPPNDQVPLNLQVGRSANHYEYADLRVFLVSQCEYEHSLATGTLPSAFSDTVSFSVKFEVPCSDVSMPFPTNNWLVKSSDADTVMVTLSGYDKDNPDFKELQIQYRKATAGKTSPSNIDNDGNLILDPSTFRPLGTPIEEMVNALQSSKMQPKKMIVDDDAIMVQGNNDEQFKDNQWINAVTIPKDSLPSTQNYVIVPWKVTSDLVPDGHYELRTISTCFAQTIIGTSVIAQGIIDRTPPTVFGSPSPLDGILGPDDEISVTFDEDIDGDDLNGLVNVKLFNTVNGTQMDKTFSYTNNSIKIVPNIQNRFIENQTLRAKVIGLKDVFGNERENDVVWEFFVDKNPMRWNDPSASVLKPEGVVQNFTRTLQNTGGSAMVFDMINLPSWLTADPMTGTIPPGFSQIVTFSISEQLTGGRYRDTIFASTTQGNEDLRLDIRVLCNSPDWTVNVGEYQYSMNIVGELLVDSILSDDVYDKVAVFVGNNTRGVGTIQYIAGVGKYELFLTIYSNQVSGEQLAFRVWDASSCRQLGQIAEHFTFQANAVHGTPNNPVSLTATDEVSQTISLAKGWTWFSLNLRRNNMSVNSLLNSVTAANNNMIKGQTSFSQAVPGIGWIGTLNTLNNKAMYQMKLMNADTIEMVGTPVLFPDTIPVVQGWNWISFQPQNGLSVDAALATLPSLNGDIIKSQFAFAVYQAPLGWLGNLSFLSPKLGYLLKAGEAGNLVYPPQMPTKAKHRNVIAEEKFPNGWLVNPSEYQYSMQIIGEAQLQSNAVDSIDFIGAFVNDECRGVVKPIYFAAPYNKYMFFLMVYSNILAGEQVHFRYYDSSEQEVHLVNEMLTFAQDSLVGGVLSPFTWNVSALGVGNETLLPKEFSLEQNYPNPFNPSTTIRYALPKEAYVEIAVYDVIGQKVATLVAEHQQPGYKSIVWNSQNENGESLGSGMYFYRMVAGDFIQSRKLVLIK